MLRFMKIRAESHEPLGAAAGAANALEQRILAGGLPPGTQLAESGLSDELDVSRNTVREAFRMLATQGLVEHIPHRGVFVRRVTPLDGRAIYEARRYLECGVLRELGVKGAPLDTAVLVPMNSAVAEAEQARECAQWRKVGAANIDFHLAVVALGGNRIIDRMMLALKTEMNLLFLGIGDPCAVHGRYVENNRHIADLISAGQFLRAAMALELYLLEAEQHLIQGAM